MSGSHEWRFCEHGVDHSQGPCWQCNEFAEFVPKDGFKTGLVGTMRRTMYFWQCANKMERDVTARLDPGGESRYVKNARRKLRQVAMAYDRYATKLFDKVKVREISEAELDRAEKVFGRLEFWAQHLRTSFHVLRGTHETKGLTPMDLERLADRYQVESSRSGLADWWILEEIQEKAFMSKLRSEKSLNKRPRTTDERIITVLNSVKGREKQARTLNMTLRNLQARIAAMRKAGKLAK